jgi:hypothetical protein
MQTDIPEKHIHELDIAELNAPTGITTHLEALKDFQEKLQRLQEQNLNDPALCRQYIFTIIQLERAIESFEYENIDALRKSNPHITRGMKLLFVGMDPKNVHHLFSFIAEELKQAVKELESAKDTESKDVFTEGPGTLHKLLGGEDNKIKDNVWKELKRFETEKEKEEKAAKSLKEIRQADIAKRNMLQLVTYLFKEIRINFEEIYLLKKMLVSAYRFIEEDKGERGRWFYFNRSEDSKKFKAEFEQLKIHMNKIEESIADEIGHIAESINDTIHAIHHQVRHDIMKEEMGKIQIGEASMDQVVEGNVFDLDNYIRTSLGGEYTKVDKLDIEYTTPWVTFEKECAKLEAEGFAKGIEEEWKKVKDLVIEISKVIEKEYEHRCDSIYHGMEHMSQVFITSVRIFKGCYKDLKLDLRDFFTLCIAAVFHDVGYFVKKFKHVTPGSLSYMNHSGHEIGSAKLAKQYLEHYKPHIQKLAMLQNEKDWEPFIGSVQNAISATELFGTPLRPDQDKALQDMLKAADLLEMCSKNYVNHLVPLYVEIKTGNPRAPWPTNVHDLLNATPDFMMMLTLPEHDKVTVDWGLDMLDKNHTRYRHNRDTIVSNMNRFLQITKKEKEKQEQKAA